MKTAHTWIAAVLVLIAGTMAAHAMVPGTTPALAWCQGCTTSQIYQTAMTQSIGSTVYVGDAIQDTVSAFDITTTGTGPGGIIYQPKAVPAGAQPMSAGKGFKVAKRITPDPDIVSAVHTAMDFYNATPTGWHKRVSIRIDASFWPDSKTLKGSVYDIIDYGHARNVFSKRPPAPPCTA